LPIACVKQRDVPGATPFARDCRAHAGVHASAQKHYRFS
jgi:hypothetical protein